MRKLSVFLLATSLVANTSEANEPESFFNLTLEELLQVKIASLTETDLNMIPASVTLISSEDIANSGARSMFELLEIMVPSLQIINHNFGTQHIGIRGIINDRDTTYLTIVNGKILNHRSKVGSVAEVDLPMLADIKEVSVIRGAGSAVYGPGAIAGVINITTYSGKTLEDNEIVYKKGFGEDFSSYELKYKNTLKALNSDLLFYYGYSDYVGANSDNAPYFVSSNTQVEGEDYQVAGDEVPYDIPNHKQNSSGQGKHKLHLQMDGDNYSTWFRYSQGGYQSVNEKGRDGQENTRGNQRHKHNKYQQYTLFFELTLVAPFDGEFIYNLSAQITEAGRIDDEYSGLTYSPNSSETPTARRSQFIREDELFLKAIYSLESTNLKQVYGIEITQDIFGKNGFSDAGIISSNSGVYPDGTFHNSTDVLLNGDWNVSTYALFSEVQSVISDEWTAFAGIRLDKHDYTDWYTSPRAALVYKPNEKHIYKAILNQSIKRASEIDMRIAYLDGEKAVEEKVKSLEFMHETQNNSALNYKTALFYQEAEFWSFSQNENKPVGTIEIAGLEFEISYKTKHHQLSLNHSYTKLLDANDTNDSQYITAEPYGYGNDLNTWSNNLTKLVYSWDLAENWLFTSSMRVYWGFDGAQDYGDYNNEQASDTLQQRFGYDDDGEAFKGNYYLNFGLHKNVNKQLKVRLNVYNTLGLANIKYNKRNYLKRFGDYRAEAAAIALNIEYQFE